MEVIKAYKIRLYPNKQQEEYLLKTIGACRWVYNHFLEEKNKYYLANKKSLTYGDTSKELTKLRKNTDWLSEVQFVPLQQSLRRLDVAYTNFFKKRARFPKFKSKKDNKQSFSKVGSWSIEGNKLSLMRDLDLKFRGRMSPNAKGTITISVTATNKWYASATALEQVITPSKYTSPIGIDLGIKDLVVTSDGERFKNLPIVSVKNIQQKLSRTKKESNGRKKARSKLTKKHEKITNIRKNYLHHLSKTIVSKNHAMIVLEDLGVKNMLQNHKLAKSISNASWSELTRQLKYKQEWNGGKYLEIDRFFPSSKTCSNCNFILDRLSLDIREWVCPRCKTKHDRDINAAKNILSQAGVQLEVETGDGIRKFTKRVTRSAKLGRSKKAIPRPKQT